MSTYAHTTFAQFKDRLASLLGDPLKVFFLDAELGLYLKEALRWWGLTAQYFRETAQVSLIAGQAFYNILTDVKDSGGTVVNGATLTDRDLITDIAYALMEPPITAWGGGWIGTEMFTLGEVSDLLAKSRDDILRMSGVVAAETAYTVTPAQQRVDLNDKTAHILRCSIQEVLSTDQPLPLWAIDYYQAQSTTDTASFLTTGRPKAYVLNYTPQLSLDLYPGPLNDATLRVYSVQAGGALDPTTIATPLGLPDDVCFLTKYRALEDLLSGDGLARAPQMAQYCHQRVQDGLEVLAQYQSLLWSTLMGRRMTIASLGQLDAQRPGWQTTQGTPRSLHQLNWNLFVCSPVPDTTYTITVDVVRSAIIPALDTDFIQVGREQMQALYDYAQHVAMFKMQGQEFAASMELYKGAWEAAQEHLAAQAGSAIRLGQQLRQAQSDRLMRPFRRREIMEQTREEALGRAA